MAIRTDKIIAARSDSSMAVRTCSLSVDSRLPDSALYSQVRGVCKALLRRWADVDDSIIAVSKITGGITNMLLKVQLEGENESQLPPVTMRVFGPNTDAVIDRERELQTFYSGGAQYYKKENVRSTDIDKKNLESCISTQARMAYVTNVEAIKQALTYLSSAGFGAKLLGVFANGMVQSFIVGRTLDPIDMAKPDLAALIATEVRRLHGLEVPGSKEPQLWEDINKFINKASGLAFDDSDKHRRYETISFDSIRAEVKEIKEISDSLRAPIVFAHNDLLSGNFMHNEEEGRMYIIDYEYGSYSYRGYDIANYFNEHAGFECNYSLYPDKEKQFYFFRHYLNPGSPEKATGAEMERLYAESNFYSLASHMYWATWAIVQAKFSPIKFDYLEYFFLRYGEYKKCKEERLSLTRTYLSGCST